MRWPSLFVSVNLTIIKSYSFEKEKQPFVSPRCIFVSVLIAVS